jgi:hypothetical protein
MLTYAAKALRERGSPLTGSCSTGGDRLEPIPVDVPKTSSPSCIYSY